jgi:hypothetical protein
VKSSFFFCSVRNLSLVVKKDASRSLLSIFVVVVVVVVVVVKPWLFLVMCETNEFVGRALLRTTLSLLEQTYEPPCCCSGAQVGFGVRCAESDSFPSSLSLNARFFFSLSTLHLLKFSDITDF